jgi:translocator protein
VPVPWCRPWASSSLLDLLVIATIAAARRHDTWAAWLLLPYLAWILYATALNAALAFG